MEEGYFRKGLNKEILVSILTPGSLGWGVDGRKKAQNYAIKKKKVIIIVLLHLKWLTDILSEQSRSHVCVVFQ